MGVVVGGPSRAEVVTVEDAVEVGNPDAGPGGRTGIPTLQVYGVGIFRDFPPGRRSARTLPAVSSRTWFSAGWDATPRPASIRCSRVCLACQVAGCHAIGS